MSTLRNRLIERNTLDRYALAAKWFFSWLLLVGLPLATTYEMLDWQTAEYVELLWEANQSYGLAGDTISSLIHFTNAKRKLPMAWRLFGAWKNKFQCAPHR